MNLNISNSDFIGLIKQSLFKIKIDGSIERSVESARATHIRLKINGETYYKYSYNIQRSKQIDCLFGVKFEEIKRDIIYWKSNRTNFKPDWGYISNGNNAFCSGYLYVIEGILFYRPLHSDYLYICTNKEGKVYGADLEVGNVNKITKN